MCVRLAFIKELIHDNGYGTAVSRGFDSADEGGEVPREEFQERGGGDNGASEPLTKEIPLQRADGRAEKDADRGASRHNRGQERGQGADVSGRESVLLILEMLAPL